MELHLASYYGHTSKLNNVSLHVSNTVQPVTPPLPATAANLQFR
jgi:hypothetical protein